MVQSKQPPLDREPAPIRLTSRAANRPSNRPYKWDVLTKVPVGTNRELWVERRWDTPDSVPYIIFVSVTYAVTDLGRKPTYQDIPETHMREEAFNLFASKYMDEALEATGFYTFQTTFEPEIDERGKIQ